MTFIPNRLTIKIGDKVRLKNDFVTHKGTFTKWHTFTCVNFDYRGHSFEDDDGNSIVEMGIIGPSLSELFEKI